MYEAGLLKVDPATLADGDLDEHLLSIIDLLERTQAAALATIGEWDARGRWALDGAVSPGQWLARHTPLSGAEARSLAATARLLRKTRLVAPALAAGELNVGQAKALASARTSRVEAIFDTHESTLIAASQPLSVDDTNRLAREWLNQADQDGPTPDHSEQSARLSITLGGRGLLEASLAADDTLIFRSALIQVMKDLYQADKDAGLTPRTAGRRRADALIEMARRAIAASDDRPAARPLIIVRCDLSDLFTRAGWQAGAPQYRYPGERHRTDNGGHTPDSEHCHSDHASDSGHASDSSHLGNGHLGNGHLGNGHLGNGAGNARREHGGHDAGTNGCGPGGQDYTGDCGRPVTDDGQPVSPSFFRQLLCDADICRVLVDGPSTVLDLGRAERTATAHQRRALLVRDGGCVFPGCDRPPGWCEAHHIDWWEDGGPTDIDNLALLCSHHHHEIHRGKFHFRRSNDGHFAFTRPDGTTIADAAPVRPRC